MGLVINHNLMAMNTARNLSNSYSRLAVSTQRLSSGLRVNSAADDAAGLAVRESMRTDIATINQGVRNAGDAISLIQTAEGALSVIDEKLTRMKELAEQAATGSYSTSQRAIMDSEYQAMAAEIDRIANATDFNGVKLLDGSMTTSHASGMKIHFGSGNSSAEDYYYINIGDMRATQSTGLQVGGGALAEVWTNSAGYSYASAGLSGGYFAFYYDVSASGTAGANDLAGIYNLASGASYGLSDIANQINLGTAARVFGTVLSGSIASQGETLMIINDKALITVTDSATSYATGSFIRIYGSAVQGLSVASQATLVRSYYNEAGNATAWGLSGSGTGNIMFIAKNPGVVGNNLSAYENLSLMSFDGLTAGTGGNFSSGGNTWATASIVQSSTNLTYSLRLTGATAGDNYDITITTPSSLVSTLGALDGGAFVGAAWNETADASGSGSWNGADILTQSHAQDALAQIDTAISTKDGARANLGALSNRFQNTITNLQIQAENTQAAESRISDVDVATEMTNFTRNSILTQAATAMLAQANALPRLALTLLGGGGGI